MVKRQQVVDYAEEYWWQPCKDGKVWVQGAEINVGLFLWYPAKDPRVSFKGMWETLALVSPADATKILKLPHEKRLLSEAKDPVLLASFKDEYKKDENLTVFPK